MKKIAVVGAGIMGNQIAMQIAIHGYDVVCYDISADMVEKAAAFSKDWLQREWQKERWKQMLQRKFRNA